MISTLSQFCFGVVLPLLEATGLNLWQEVECDILASSQGAPSTQLGLLDQAKPEEEEGGPSLQHVEASLWVLNCELNPYSRVREKSPLSIFVEVLSNSLK